MNELLMRSWMEPNEGLQRLTFRNHFSVTQQQIDRLKSQNAWSNEQKAAYEAISLSKIE